MLLPPVVTKEPNVTADADRGPGRRKVAVLVVHGVGNQTAGSTSTAVADLLANLEDPADDRMPLYTSFQGHDLRLPVRRLGVASHVPSRISFAKRARTLRHDRNRAPIDVEFTRSLLVDYQVSGPEDTYETVVLSATRRAGPDTPPIDVDVHEMYWADLSRLTQSAFSVLSETYQLLFHLGSLGVHAVSAAEASSPEVGNPAVWSWWAAAQRLSADAISLGAGLANLVLAGLALVLVGSALIPDQPLLSVLLGGLLVTVCAAATAYKYPWARWPWRVVFAGVVVWAGWSLARTGIIPLPGEAVGERTLTTELWLLAAIAFAGVVRLYNQLRPGATVVGLVFGLVASARLLLLTWTAVGPMGAALDAGALACLMLAVSWIVFFASTWVAFLTGRWIVWTAARASAELVDRVRRTDWTARITAAIPAALFVLATTIFWGAAWQLADGRIEACVPGTPIVGAFEDLLLQDTSTPPSDCDEASVNPSRIVRSVIDTSAAWGFGALMTLVALSGIVGLFALAPSAFDEIVPPKNVRDGQQLGRWLDLGLRRCRVIGHLLWCGVCLVLPAGLVAVTLTPMSVQDPVRAWADLNVTLLTVVVSALAPVAAGVMTFGRRLKMLAPGFRTVVDAALDVDNHLREHPRNATPRARVLARYASVLRRLYTHGYEKIIIVSHSQGTAITGDLLRYVTYEARGTHRTLVDDICGRPSCPLILMTMGSPLRQLYGLRFPFLYGWARYPKAPACAASVELPRSAEPDPASVGVHVWANLYRSGDYVGRNLWRPDACAPLNQVAPESVPQPWPLTLPLPQQASTDGTQTRIELCLGAGAHTHYWDRTAPGVALTLDAFIAQTPATFLKRATAEASRPGAPC